MTVVQPPVVSDIRRAFDGFSQAAAGRALTERLRAPAYTVTGAGNTARASAPVTDHAADGGVRLKAAGEVRPASPVVAETGGRPLEQLPFCVVDDGILVGGGRES